MFETAAQTASASPCAHPVSSPDSSPQSAAATIAPPNTAIPPAAPSQWNRDGATVIATRIPAFAATIQARKAAATSFAGNADCISVERYDRIVRNGIVRRVHQEGSCQALAIHPARKYQNEGGPSAADIFALLRSHGAPDADIGTFLETIVFNWLIGGTDAHAKNYSILIGGNGAIRLAPLYDFASIYAYGSIDPRKAKLAMKIGGEYNLLGIGPAQWHRFARDVRLWPDHVAGRIRALAAALPNHLADVLTRMTASGITHPVIDRLIQTLPPRAGEALILAESIA